MNKSRIEEPWLADALELSLRSGMSLKSALTQMGVEVDLEELHKIQCRASYQKLLWALKHKIALELGGDPELTKQVGIGHLILQADALTQEGQHDKAAEVWFKIAKLEGWVGVEGQVNVFGDLTQADLDRIKESVSRGPGRPSVN